MRIPSIVLATITTAACTDPMVGDWELDGEPQCQENTYEEGTVSYCISFDWDFSLDEEYKGDTTIATTMKMEGTYADGTLAYSEEETYDYQGTVSATETENGYDIAFDVENDEVVLGCTLSEAQLDCIPEDEDMAEFFGDSIVFNKKTD